MLIHNLKHVYTIDILVSYIVFVSGLRYTGFRYIVLEYTVIKHTLNFALGINSRIFFSIHDAIALKKKEL